VSTPRIVYFVCSSALHVNLFASTIRSVALSGCMQPIILSLDSFYKRVHGNVKASASALQLPAVIVDTVFARGAQAGFIAKVYASQRFGVQEFVNILKKNKTSLVVLGNDTGHAERAVIAAASRLNIKTLLVQDGFLFDQFPKGFSGRFWLMVRKLWLILGGNRLGWVPYGMGGCHAIAVHGRSWMETILRGKRGATKRIEVTGHPALISPGSQIATPLCGHDVLYFCSNFLSAHKDADAHVNQIDEIIALRDLLRERYGDCVTLYVKLHPADRLEDYATLSSMNGVILHKDAVLNDLIQKSWLCVTNISSASLECLAAGRVCLMSGISMKSRSYRRLFASLPGTKFLTWEALRVWLDQLDSATGYTQALAMQREGLESWVGDFGKGTERLVALIGELSMTNTAWPESEKIQLTVDETVEPPSHGSRQHSATSIHTNAGRFVG